MALPFALPLALLGSRAANVYNPLLIFVAAAVSAFYAGRAHSVCLGPDFIAGNGQRIRFSDIRAGTSMPGFIGDFYVSDSSGVGVGVSSVFLSRAQRSEIARRISQYRSSTDTRQAQARS
jgi:hypothetical protein